MLAEETIKKGGVVFGARFDQCWDVIHSFSASLEDVNWFRGSKYVQSRIENCFQLTECFLKDKREVLFTGTPCQIAGLKRFLGIEYDNLTTVSVVCKGVSSPVVWRSYLRHIIGVKSASCALMPEESSRITSISFRDKSFAWNKYCVRIEGTSRCGRHKRFILEKYYYNTFTRAFFHNYILRPSCYDCPAKNGKSCSDILLGDFWGIRNYHPDFYSHDGVSMVLAYSEKGVGLIDSLDVDNRDIPYEETRGNKSIETSVSKPADRDLFFRSFQNKGAKSLSKYNYRNERHLFSFLVGKYVSLIQSFFK